MTHSRRPLPAAVWLLPLLCACLALTACHGTRNSLAQHKSSGQWEREISAIETRNRTHPPPAGCIVFVGSSSIRLWTNLAAAFPGLPVVNCGFGGSMLADSVIFADRIIVPLVPQQVVVYAGGNDINAGKEPALVYGDFVALVEKLRAKLPEVRIAFISVAPNPARWSQVDQVRRLNSLVAAYCHKEGLDFINVFPLMLDMKGEPKPEIFVADRLHMNAQGYAIWREAVAPCLTPKR